MSWWQKILETINVGDKLYTPGRGMEGTLREPFWIIEIGNDKLVIKSGDFPIPIERICFDALEKAFRENRELRLRVASSHSNTAFEGSADELIRRVTNSNLSRGNYVCSILEKIEVVRYIMDGRRKCIELRANQTTDHLKKKMNYKITILIEKDEHGYYAFCPELEGCQSQGDSLEEVLANIREAVELYLETLSEEEIKASLSKEILTTSMEVRVG